MGAHSNNHLPNKKKTQSSLNKYLDETIALKGYVCAVIDIELVGGKDITLERVFRLIEFVFRHNSKNKVIVVYGDSVYLPKEIEYLERALYNRYNKNLGKEKKLQRYRNGITDPEEKELVLEYRRDIGNTDVPAFLIERYSQKYPGRVKVFTAPKEADFQVEYFHNKGFCNVVFANDADMCFEVPTVHTNRFGEWNVKKKDYEQKEYKLWVPKIA